MPAAGPQSVPADPSLPNGSGRNATSTTGGVGARTVDGDPPIVGVDDAEIDLPASGRRGPTGTAASLLERPVLSVAVVAISTAMAVMAAAAGSAAWQDRSGPPVEDLLPIVAPVVPIPTTTPMVIPVDHIVHIAGAVQQPGVVRVPEGSRVIDALDAAGGAATNADLDRLNLAAPVADGQRVHVPLIGQDSPTVVNPVGSEPSTSGPAEPSIVSLNIASARELETLTGVGPATAAAILDFRDRNGPFTSVDGLLDVPGIGPAKLEAMRSRIAIDP